MRIYYVENDTYDGEQLVEDTEFFLTEELARAAMEQLIAERRANWERNEAGRKMEWENKMAARKCLLAAGLPLTADLAWVWDEFVPKEFKHYMEVWFVEVKEM